MWRRGGFPDAPPGVPGRSAQREFERRRRGERRRARRRLPVALVVVAAAGAGGYAATDALGAVALGHLRIPSVATARVVPVAAGAAAALVVVTLAVGVAGALRRVAPGTGAWAVGAQGERTVADRLRPLSARGIAVLHDRRIPGGRANIDHIAVGPRGVFVIDAKVVSGKVALRTAPWPRRRRSRTLVVGGRRRPDVVPGILRQVAAVQGVLRSRPEDLDTPVRPLVVVVGAARRHRDSPLSVDGVWVGSPAAMVREIRGRGRLRPDDIRRLARHIAERLPAA